MIDLHTHTLLSDGALIPSELARRAEELGCRYLGYADHVDASNIEDITPRLKAAALANNKHTRIKTLPGVELTHVPPPLIAQLAEKARSLGAAFVVVHGESLVEPVAPGTNRAALEAGVDILAHPGLITPEEVELAAAKGVLLELTTRRGHSLTNGHVAALALEKGAGLIINTDAHAPGDLISLDFARKTALGAGLDLREFERIRGRAWDLVARVGQQYM